MAGMKAKDSREGQVEVEVEVERQRQVEAKFWCLSASQTKMLVPELSGSSDDGDDGDDVPR